MVLIGLMCCDKTLVKIASRMNDIDIKRNSSSDKIFGIDHAIAFAPLSSRYQVVNGTPMPDIGVIIFRILCLLVSKHP